MVAVGRAVTPEQVQAARALAVAATPGPWQTDGGQVVETEEPPGDGTFEGDRADVCEVLHYGFAGHGTAEFIAAARELVPALCDDLEAARLRLSGYEKDVREYEACLRRAHATFLAQRDEAERMIAENERLTLALAAVTRERDEARQRLAYLEVENRIRARDPRRWCP